MSVLTGEGDRIMRLEVSCHGDDGGGDAHRAGRTGAGVDRGDGDEGGAGRARQGRVGVGRRADPPAVPAPAAGEDPRGAVVLLRPPGRDRRRDRADGSRGECPPRGGGRVAAGGAVAGRGEAALSRLYTDVHVPAAVTAALRVRGVDVVTAQEDGRGL